MTILHFSGVCRNSVVGALLALALIAVDTNQSAVAQDSEKSIGELRKEAEKAEKDLYSLFNDINSDDDFDVRCKRERALGSRRKVQVCTPKFQRRIESNISADQVNQAVPVMPGTQMQEKQQLMRQEMTDLLATNEDFSAAFNKYAAAKRAYETKLQGN
ncbi:MAG: hypothetical protein ACR2Q3_16980 [Woeseiaceae bacterium]